MFQCSATRCAETGIQSRLVVCRLPDGDILANSNCDSRNKPQDTMSCKGPCDEKGIPTTWQKGPWSAVSSHSPNHSDSQGQMFKPSGRLHYRLPMHLRRPIHDRNTEVRYSRYFDNNLSVPTVNPYINAHPGRQDRNTESSRDSNSNHVHINDRPNLDEVRSRFSGYEESSRAQQVSDVTSSYIDAQHNDPKTTTSANSYRSNNHHHEYQNKYDTSVKFPLQTAFGHSRIDPNHRQRDALRAALWYGNRQRSHTEPAPSDLSHHHEKSGDSQRTIQSSDPVTTEVYSTPRAHLRPSSERQWPGYRTYASGYSSQHRYQGQYSPMRRDHENPSSISKQSQISSSLYSQRTLTPAYKDSAEMSRSGTPHVFNQETAQSGHRQTTSAQVQRYSQHGHVPGLVTQQDQSVSHRYHLQMDMELPRPSEISRHSTMKNQRSAPVKDFGHFSENEEVIQTFEQQTQKKMNKMDVRHAKRGRKNKSSSKTRNLKISYRKKGSKHQQKQ